MAMKVFAAIEVGSFELDMGIYEISSKFGIRRIDLISHGISLGKDTYNNGKVSYELVEEICQVLSDFSSIMKAYQVTDYRAYATSAMREAKNNRIVIDQILVRTGIEVKIMSNSELRLISYKSIASKDVEFQKIIQKGTAIADVGFGSMQVSLFDKDTLVTTQNLQLGILRLKGMLEHAQVSDKVACEMLEEVVDNELFTFRKMYLKDRNIKNLVGIGAGIVHLYRKAPDGTLRDRITAEELKQFYDSLHTMNQDQIADRFGINTEQASLLLPGTIVYKHMMDLTGAETFWIPEGHLCDGMAAEYAEENRLVKFQHNFEEDIIATARNMAKRYKCHVSHVQAVEQYVLDVFDTMKKYHGLGNRERLLLQIAANLHSCGKFISIRDSSECAYNIIMSTEIIGLSHREREIIANVVKYDLQPFQYDEVENPMLLAKLVAILRLANAMDRGHKKKLAGCRMRIKENELIINTEYDGDMTLEKLSFESKVKFFEEIYGIRPVLKQKRRV